MYFKVGATKNQSGYSWWLYADNEEMVAWAGEIFPSHANAERAASAFRTSSPFANYDVYPDAGGREWRWRAVFSSDKVAASGESFDSRFNAERAKENVRLNAQSARGL